MNFWRVVHSGVPTRKWLPSPRRYGYAMQVTLLHATGRNFRSHAYVGTKYCRSGFCESEWLQYKYPWRWWHSGGEPGGFGLLQSLSLYSRGTSWSVSLLQSGILTIRIFAYVHRIHAPRLVSFQPAEFRLHSRARHRNFYSCKISRALSGY